MWKTEALFLGEVMFAYQTFLFHFMNETKKENLFKYDLTQIAFIDSFIEFKLQKKVYTE